jgi:molybdopterin converting factor small subunit
MARVTIALHGQVAEKAGKNKLYLTGDTVKEIMEKLKREFPFIEKEIKYNNVICMVNGRNIETLKKDDTELEDFDLLRVTLKDGSYFDFFPPDGGG